MSAVRSFMRLSQTALVASRQRAALSSLQQLSFPMKNLSFARMYSDKKPSSLLSDDLLAKAGIDPAAIAKEAPASGAGASAASRESNESSRQQQEGSTTEEQRERWKGTAKKAGTKTTTDIQRERRSNYFYIASLGMLLGGAIYLARDWEEGEQSNHPTVPGGLTPTASWARFQVRLGDVFGYFNEPVFDELLPDPLPEPYGRPFTLVLGLDDVLIHSEWTRQYGWRTAKRPGLDYFLGYLAQYYEIVIFSSSYMLHSEKVVAKLDPYRSSISHALYREATRYKDGKVIKDLSMMNRDIGKVILIDCRSDAYSMQPDNAIPLEPWSGSPSDKDLVKLIPFLEWLATQPIKDVRPILKSFEGTNIPDEFNRREVIARKKFEEQWNNEHVGASNNWAAAFLGVKPPVPAAPMMPQDYIRQEGQKSYEAYQKFIQENGEKMLAEEKAREREILNDQKFTLNKLVTEGLPKPEEIAAMQQQKEAEKAAAAAAVAAGK